MHWKLQDFDTKGWRKLVPQPGDRVAVYDSKNPSFGRVVNDVYDGTAVEMDNGARRMLAGKYRGRATATPFLGEAPSQQWRELNNAPLYDNPVLSCDPEPIHSCFPGAGWYVVQVF